MTSPPTQPLLQSEVSSVEYSSPHQRHCLHLPGWFQLRHLPLSWECREHRSCLPEELSECPGLGLGWNMAAHHFISGINTQCHTVLFIVGKIGLLENFPLHCYCNYQVFKQPGHTYYIKYEYFFTLVILVYTVIENHTRVFYISSVSWYFEWM